jgi:hypothetical protein
MKILRSNAPEACEHLILEEVEGHITPSIVGYIRQKICDVFLISTGGCKCDTHLHVRRMSFLSTRLSLI